MTEQAGAQGRRVPPRRDAGVTFVELLITIVLMGTVVLGILTATQVLIRASRTNHEAASVTSALLAAAERIERAPRPAFKCEADLQELAYAAAQLKLGVSADEVANYVDLGYEHLEGDNWVDGACPSPGGFEPGVVQRIHITMIGPDTGLERNLEVIKGDV